MKTIYVNVGCGNRFFKGDPWVNMDVGASDTSVVSWDIRAGLPMESETVDMIYLSHVLEHFSADDGRCLINDFHRALKPGGVLRIVVPNLEGICREYLRQLDAVRDSSSGYSDRLEWIKLELLDQCMRHESGGGMKNYFRDHGANQADYVVSRIGTIGRQLCEVSQRCVMKNHRKQGKGGLRKALLRLLLGSDDFKALQVGRFRLQGEVHLQMYDSYSLTQELKNVGFERVALCDADKSNIAKWGMFQLDRDGDGIEHAPNSLYVEAIKKNT